MSQIKERIGIGVGVMVVAGALVVSAGPAGAGKGNEEVIGSGPDYVYSGGDSLEGADITVTAGKLGNGNSQITLIVEGADATAGTKFGAHVHESACGATGTDSGPHYNHGDLNGPLSQREVWLDFSLDAHGRGHAVATRSFEVPDRASRSVIVHVMDTDHETGAAGARLACVDLDA